MALLLRRLVTSVYEAVRGAGGAGDHLVADKDGVLAFKDVEGFVLAVMYVKGGAAPLALATSTAPSTPFVSLADASTVIVCWKKRIDMHPLLVSPCLTHPECPMAFEHR
jgi:hypothetical protein